MVYTVSQGTIPKRASRQFYFYISLLMTSYLLHKLQRFDSTHPFLCFFFNFCHSSNYRNDSQKDLWSIGSRWTEHFFTRFDRHGLELCNSGRNSHVVSDCITLRNTAKAQDFKTRDIFAYSLAATFVISANFRSSFLGTCGTRLRISGILIIAGFTSVWIVMWNLFEYYTVWMWAIQHGH